MIWQISISSRSLTTHLTSEAGQTRPSNSRVEVPGVVVGPSWRRAASGFSVVVSAPDEPGQALLDHPTGIGGQNRICISVDDQLP